MQCRQNSNFEETDTESTTGKNDGFWLLWVIFKEYVKQKAFMALLRKANCQSVDIYRLTKNQ